ncbi:MAG: methylmalonyl-CoA mutase, partial [Alphaproteobacteria bacterium]|nr:methylmalonyl-CoA mutase [Alphaproteobacteria bacterium]
EEAVLAELDRIASRGGVLGAMESGYQRGKIQDESLHYEMLKHDGSLPLVGVNTFRNPNPPPTRTTVALQRSSDTEKNAQLDRLRTFQMRNVAESANKISMLKKEAMAGGNVFAALMQVVRYCSLGQVTDAFFEVGGQYRRNT